MAPLCHLQIVPMLHLKKWENVSADETNRWDTLNPREGIFAAQFPAAFFLNFLLDSIV